jgi:hypothetical protein
MLFMVVTLITFQPLILLLNVVLFANKLDMSVIAETFHELIVTALYEAVAVPTVVEPPVVIQAVIAVCNCALVVGAKVDILIIVIHK